MGQDVRLCRLCAKSCENSSSIPLFERSQKTVILKIFHVTGIKLKNLSKLPNIMCVSCQIQLERAYEFRDCCITAQKYFSSSEYKRTSSDKSSKKEQDFEMILSEQEFDLKAELEPYFLQEPETTELKLDILPLPNVKTDLENEPVAEVALEAAPYENDVGEMRGRPKKSPSHKILQRNKRGVKYKNTLENEETTLRPVDNVLKSTDVENNTTQNENMNQNRKITKERKNKARTYICDQCGNHFKYRSHFYSHIKRHSGVKPIQCEVCPNKFFTQGELKRHMRRHTGERPFPCKHCQRRFTDYSTRIKHERTHTNERPFECSQCGKAFTTSYVLKNHMLVHTGERSFKCTLCNKSFQRQTHLIVHNRSLAHKQNVEREQQILV
uniref:Zinc finger protein with KRAB and SCAN domains 3 n=1 Tax=Ceratitis capitata TaxID=7213 RepID=W8CCL2_CERCA